ncbi:TVP38/TMEM64 family protein [Thioalkalivibrio paradoxus]|uniref:TVP38/TMEM64 family membrane protein n=1 Tax=Thioalkalivibrio paradoxus ARh 1 TaxID=713585 RepID=W0DKH5_9GAMM|nr:TVP38/TMEM64 family protein [Thioalkalivibrio paradoxus]AHE97717.1 sulfurtransferase [Thioalkalivibrio paradoxus ARh 1]
MSPWIWGTILLLVAGIVIYLFGWIPIEEIDFALLEARFHRFGVWSYLLFVVGFVVLAMFPIPSTIWVLLGGSLFGPALGTVLSVGSATIAAVLAFVTGRYLARDYVRAHAGPRTCRVIRGVEAEGWRFVAMTRLIPVFPFAPTNYALGLTGIRLRTYTVTTAIALIPNLAAYTWLGHATRQAISGAENLIQFLLLVLALIAMLLFLPGFIRRLANHSTDPC